MRFLGKNISRDIPVTMITESGDDLTFSYDYSLEEQDVTSMEGVVEIWEGVTMDAVNSWELIEGATRDSVHIWDIKDLEEDKRYAICYTDDNGDHHVDYGLLKSEVVKNEDAGKYKIARTWFAVALDPWDSRRKAVKERIEKLAGNEVQKQVPEHKNTMPGVERLATVDFAFANLRVEKNVYEYEGGKTVTEIMLCLEDKDTGAPIQDLVLVRKADDAYTSEYVGDSDATEILVWADSGDENYTDTHVVNLAEWED